MDAKHLPNTAMGNRREFQRSPFSADEAHGQDVLGVLYSCDSVRKQQKETHNGQAGRSAPAGATVAAGESATEFRDLAHPGGTQAKCLGVALGKRDPGLAGAVTEAASGLGRAAFSLVDIS